MLKVGLTGNFYSGQNEVSKIFESIGVKVFDADLLLKYFINYSSEHIELIRNHFGESSYSLGLLNFYKFNSNKTWNELIDLLQFDILKSYEKFRLNNKEDYYTIFKFQFLYERNMNESFDRVISCYRPSSYRRSDLQTLTYLDSFGIESLLKNEMSEAFKNEKSNFVINNYLNYDGEHSQNPYSLESKVRNVHLLLTKNKPRESEVSGSKYDLSLVD
jgi:dephospho-CoA kinase